MRCAAAILALAIGLGGCAKRATPYRFRAPLVDGVAAAELPRRGERERRPARRTPKPRPRPVLPMATTAELPLRPTVPEISPPVATLYAFVGQRDDASSSIALAFRATSALGIVLDPSVREASDGRALVELARARGAYDDDGPPLLGDFIVFDRARGAGDAALVGVVVASRTDGTVEFIYLERGVIRRGWANPRRPTDQRNRDGVVLNTFLRPDTSTRGSGLAGGMLAGYVRVDRLASARVADQR